MWLTPDVAIAGADGHYWGQLFECCFCFTVDGNGKEIFAFARSSQTLSGIVDIVLRLLAVSVVHSVNLNIWSCDFAPINAPTLAYLMEHCQSLKAITSQDLALDEDYYRVPGAYSRPDLEIELEGCVITGAGAIALAEILGRNQGPTKLDYCDIDAFLLADGLRGNSRLKSFSPNISREFDIGSPQLLAIADAIRENKGLVEWRLSLGVSFSDEMWDAKAASTSDTAAFAATATVTVVATRVASTFSLCC
jgi:hypothetical protein